MFQYIIMTCFTFGAGIPVLFLIAVCSVTIMYQTEKKVLVRQVSLPTNYDPRINKDLVSFLLFGPIFYSAMGYWMYSNPHIMGNETIPVESARDIIRVKRNFNDPINKLTPGTPFLFLLAFSIMVKIDHHTKIFTRLFGK